MRAFDLPAFSTPTRCDNARTQFGPTNPFTMKE